MKIGDTVTVLRADCIIEKSFVGQTFKIINKDVYSPHFGQLWRVKPTFRAFWESQLQVVKSKAHHPLTDFFKE